MTAKAPIILVHGAWSSSSTWDAVVPLLSAAGHSVLALDLPSHGADKTPAGKVTLADYANRVAKALDDTGPAILVGHSMGGMAISAGAELQPDKVLRLVYVAAFLPLDGQSLLDLIKQQDQPGVRDLVRPGKQPGSTELDPALAVEVLCQDATPDQRTRAIAGLQAQPNRAQTDPASLRPDRFGRLARTYIICERDRTVTPALQRQMIAASPCQQVHSLDSGHLPQLTRPAELAEILTQ